MKEKLEKILSAAAKSKITLDFQPREEFGHLTTSAAMRLGKEKGKNPRDIAEELRAGLLKRAPEAVAKAEVAGPGFLNIWLADEAVRR